MMSKRAAVLMITFLMGLGSMNVMAGETEADESLPEDRTCDHIYSYQLQDDSYEATDEKGGYRHYKCSECGEEYAYTTDPMVYETNPNTGEAVDQAGSVNPNLPLWERIPDAEPHVFWSKADHEWRAYMYGSHDTGEIICGQDQVVWSAPVYDLSDWRFDGQIYDVYEKEGAEDIKLNALFAPDVDYDVTTDTFYMMTFEVFDREALVRCTEPDGRFDGEDNFVYEFSEETGWGPYVTTDPAIYIENGTIYVIASAARGDLSDPEYVSTLTSAEGLQDMLDKITESGEESNQFALVCKMKEDASQGVDELHYCSLEGKGFFPIFEGVSLRYDDESGKYIMVYYGNKDGAGSNEADGLAYAYTDDLMNGEWILGDNTFGDCVIYDNNGVYLTNAKTGELEKTDQATYSGGNNHGGLVKINGDWYIFGHVTAEKRMNTIEKVELQYDAETDTLTIPAVEMTSSGAADSLDAYNVWDAGIFCYAVPEAGASYGDGEETEENMFAETEEEGAAEEGETETEADMDAQMFAVAEYGEGKTVPVIASYTENTVSSHGDPGTYDMDVKHVTPVRNIHTENILGYKYVNFGGEECKVALNLLVNAEEDSTDGTVGIYLDAPTEKDGGTYLGTAQITKDEVAASDQTEDGTDGSSWTWISSDMENPVSGTHAVYFVFHADTADQTLFEIDQFSFEAK